LLKVPLVPGAAHNTNCDHSRHGGDSCRHGCSHDHNHDHNHNHKHYLWRRYCPGIALTLTQVRDYHGHGHAHASDDYGHKSDDYRMIRQSRL